MNSLIDAVKQLQGRTDIPPWEYDGLNDDEVANLWSISTNNDGLIRLESPIGEVFTAQLGRTQ